MEDEDDLLFFRFCFLGMFGRSGGSWSLKISDVGCCPISCSKSDIIKNKEFGIRILKEKLETSWTWKFGKTKFIRP